MLAALLLASVFAFTSSRAGDVPFPATLAPGENLVALPGCARDQRVVVLPRDPWDLRSRLVFPETRSPSQNEIPILVEASASRDAESPPIALPGCTAPFRVAESVQPPWPNAAASVPSPSRVHLAVRLYVPEEAGERTVARFVFRRASVFAGAVLPTPGPPPGESGDTFWLGGSILSLDESGGTAVLSVTVMSEGEAGERKLVVHRDGVLFAGWGDWTRETVLDSYGAGGEPLLIEVRWFPDPERAESSP